jgi:hypothetical protein
MLLSHDRAIRKNPASVSRRLVTALSVLVLSMTAPLAAEAAPQAGPPEATVKIEVGHLHGGRAPIYGTVPVNGTISPFAPGQRVEVTFYLDGHKLLARKAAVQQGKGGVGTFKA